MLTQESPEEVNIFGQGDILSRALERPEYSGRVRGTGIGVTPSAYFGRQQRVTQSEVSVLKDEVNTLRETVLEMQRRNEEMQRRQDMMYEFFQRNNVGSQMSNFMQQGNVPSCQSPSIRDSCTMPRAQIPQVILVFCTYKLVVTLLYYRLGAYVVNSFVGRIKVQPVQGSIFQ